MPAPQDLRLRPEAEPDLPFLRTLYASSREREMALLPHWSQEQKESFLKAQFEAQRSYYYQHYGTASYDIVELPGRPIGRLYVADLARQVILMDITLLRTDRNKGLGEALVRQVQQQALAAGKIVSLHVEENNPAHSLYLRLGFTEVAEVSFYKLMHWVPQGLQAVSDSLSAEAEHA